MTVFGRFLAKLNMQGPVPEYAPDLGRCWLWTDVPRRDGYGSFYRDGTTHLAHRTAYELLVGPIPDGLTIDHLCRVRHCVNPEHLQPVTIGENVLRGIGPAAVNATKTHCYRGHALTGANVRLGPDGKRYCRACNRERSRVHRAKQREAA